MGALTPPHVLEDPPHLCALGAAWQRLKPEGLSLVVIDKDLEALMRLGDRHVVFGKGRVAWTGDSQQLRAARDVQDGYIGV